MSTLALAAAPRRWSTITGMGLATRFAWRRSRIFFTVWVLSLWTAMPLTMSQYSKIIPNTDAGRATALALGTNPTMRAILGPPYDLLHGASFTMFRVGTFTAAAGAFMAALGVIRATRAEEEEGRVELLRAGAIGRHAPLVGGITAALGACAAFGMLTSLTLGAMGAAWAGAVCCGLGFGLTGAIFVGVGAVTAQVFESARAARFAALGGVLAGGYLLRAIADASSDASALHRLQWLSPLEWAALARPWVHERWWVLLLPLALTIALIGSALALETHRDHGSGLLVARPGRATASPGLRDAASLARRLQRGSLIGWTIGMLVTALALKQLSHTIDTMINGSTQITDLMRKMGGGGQKLSDDFVVAMVGILTVVLAMMGLQLLGRLSQEESRGQAELMLSTATSRRAFALSHLGLALVAPAVLLLLTGVLMGPGAHQSVATMIGASGALLPALWFTVALSMAMVGWAPGLTWIAWALVGWSLFLTWVGGLLGLPSWALRLSPFALLPKLPVDPMRWPWVIAELVADVALLAAGLVGYQRRNIPTL